jgi:hypothetical protein
MRARNIKPGLFKNEVLGAADPLLTLLFEGLWMIADREGRLEDRPLRIKAELFAYREIPDIDGLLTQLESMGFLRRYKVNNARLIQVIKFKEHQSPHHTEKKSQLPAPVNSPLDNGEYRESNGEYPPDSLIPASLILRFKVKTLKHRLRRRIHRTIHNQLLYQNQRTGGQFWLETRLNGFKR